jgi:hypothetical protein
VARFAPLYDVPILDAAADVRATFFNTEKWSRGAATEIHAISHVFGRAPGHGCRVG